MPKEIRTMNDALEDLKDLSTVLSYEKPQITDKQIVNRLEKDIKVIEHLQPLIDQFQLETFSQELDVKPQMKKV